MSVFLIDSHIQDRIRNGNKEPLTNDEYKLLTRSMHTKINNLPNTSKIPAILTPLEIRKMVKRLIKREFPDVDVLSYDEMLPGAVIEPIATFSLQSK